MPTSDAGLSRTPPIRVGVVGYGLDRPTTGISRYTIELLNAVHAGYPEIALTLLAPFTGTVPGLAPAIPRQRLPGCRRLPGMMTIGPVALAAAARRLRLDVVHDPTGIAPFLIPRRFGGFGRVVTIHDAVPFVHPETHARLTNLLFRHYIPRALPAVDRVITVSAASRRDLLRFYNLPETKDDVIPAGVAARVRPMTAAETAPTLANLGIARPFLLAVGALQPRKNLETLFEAFARLWADGLRHQLVVVGPKAWHSAGIFQKLDGVGLGDAITLTGYVDDADLPALYAAADCFVFPSLYEGFGLPPLEAMACGAPVVCSNTSSLPELVGEAALLVDPRDPAALAAAIHRVVTEPALAANLRGLGLARARSYTWDRAAADHAGLYRAIAERR